jgi:hypothetical protein
MGWNFSGIHSTPQCQKLPTMTITAPTSIRAGDSATWSTELPAYAATDGWVLKHRILWRTAGPAPVDITTTGSGTTHTATLSSATTTAFTAGPASLVSWVERTGERITLEQQPLQIDPDLTTATASDVRSLNQKALDAARAALADYVASGQMKVASYTINGRDMQFRSTQDLQNLVQHYEREVFKEQALQAAINGVAAGRVITRM